MTFVLRFWEAFQIKFGMGRLSKIDGTFQRCFGSCLIRIIWPDPDLLQKTLIRIRVAKKNCDKLAYIYKSTKIIRM